MKKFFLISLIIIFSPVPLYGSYSKALEKRTESAIFHAQLVCKIWKGDYSQKKASSMSARFLQKTFTKSETKKLLDKGHTDAVIYLAEVLKQKNCNHKKINKTGKSMNKFIDILIQGY